MGPKRKNTDDDNTENKKTNRTDTPPLIESESESDATNISLDEGSQTPLLSDSDEEGSEEEGALSQEDQEFVQALSQGNEGIEEDAINALVEDVEQSQSDAELSQSQSQYVIEAAESQDCGLNEANEVQLIENRLTNPGNASDRLGQLYSELLLLSSTLNENIRHHIEHMLIAIRNILTSPTAEAVLEQVNTYIIPLVRTVSTTCAGYYLGSYVLRYISVIITRQLQTNTTVTLISLGSIGVHIVYNIGTPEGGTILDNAIASVNANITAFIDGVNRISNIPTDTIQLMRTSTLEAVRGNVQNAINVLSGERQTTVMANIMSELQNLSPNDAEFQDKIKAIQDELNGLMAPTNMPGEGNNDGFNGGKRTKKNKKFKKHYMWNTKGKRYLAKTYKQHMRGAKLGHTHKKPKSKKNNKRKTKKIKST
jgi:hypothetical protein